MFPKIFQLTSFCPGTQPIKLKYFKETLNTRMPIIEFIFLSQSNHFLPNNCTSRGLLLHFITNDDTNTPLEDRLVAGATPHNTKRRKISMPLAGFKPTIPVSGRPYT